MNRTKAITISILSAALAFGACKKDEPKKAVEAEEPAKKVAETPPEPVEPAAADFSTQESKLARFNECWAAWSNADGEAFRACYADATDFRLVDNVPEMGASDGDGAAKISTGFKTAFPDMIGTPQLTMVSGSNVAAIMFIKGTNTGSFMGMPATGKSVGYFHAQAGSISDEGKVTRDHHTTDQMSLMHQLGMLPPEAAARSASALDAGWDKATVVMAKDDDTEKANVEAVNALFQLVMKGDSKAVGEACADDAIFHYIGGNEGPKNGRDAYVAALSEFIGMTSERSIKSKATWGAQDWVVAEVETTAKISKNLGKAKTKGKTIVQNEVHFFQMAEGKLKKHYLFSNDMASAVQMGLVDPTKFAPPKEGEKPAEKK
jgi:predicted ester cyclase